MINELNQQYEEVDSKKEAKEEKINLDDVLKANELTEKWLDEVREYKENSKDDNYSREAFTKKTSGSAYEREKRDSDKKKEEKKSYSYSYYGSRDKDEKSSSSYRYGSRSYSSSSSSSKSSDELFYEKVEKMFNDKVTSMIDDLMDKHLNRIGEENHDWDILDLQYELNKKRINDRDYEDEPVSIEFNKTLEKKSNSCARKIDIAEILVILKVNPFN